MATTVKVLQAITSILTGSLSKRSAIRLAMFSISSVGRFPTGLFLLSPI